jgi:hypothetical protein
MTIKTPPDNFCDHILNLFGKKRRVVFPEYVSEIYEKHGQYTTIKAKKENFWRALFRKSNESEM